MDTILTDTWIISMPEDWIEKGVAEGGSLYFESSDGEKAIYITTWNLSENYLTPPVEVVTSFMTTDLNAINDMEGYKWESIAE